MHSTPATCQLCGPALANTCNCLKPSCRWCRPALARLAAQGALRLTQQAIRLSQAQGPRPAARPPVAIQLGLRA